MALEDIDLPRRGTHGHTPDERLQAALAWTITGTSQGASTICGIPASTIRDWSNQEYWPALVAEARQLKQEELDAALTSIVDKCTKLIAQRLDSAMNDPDIEKGVRGLAITAAVAIDKRALLRGDPTSRTERVTVGERLERLRGEFAGMQANKSKQSDQVKH